MTFQPWILWTACGCASSGRNIERFNGAMTFQPWIPPKLAEEINPGLPLLQWSHDLSAMDTRILPCMATIAIGLQWSHDLSAMDTRSHGEGACGKSCGFNGAMTFQPWILHIVGVSLIPPSFNGAMTFQPWIRPIWFAATAIDCTRFNGAMTFQPWIPARSLPRNQNMPPLQWSHDLSAMDTRAVPGVHLTSGLTSFNGAMTFQPWIRKAGNASMEP